MPLQFPRWAKHLTTAMLLVVMSFFSVPTYANPLGGEVITGDVTIHEATGGTLNIDQLSDRAIIEWQSFSIDNGELTQFFQPGAQAAILNRVTGGSPSEINGALRGNGNVWVINQNGILFGANSTVDVYGLVVSTLDVSNEAFIAGGDMPLSGGGIGDTVNFGTINAVGGDVFLVGRSVVNHGAIGAVDGTVGLAAGNRVLLNASGSERVFVSAGEGSVTNTGEIRSAMAELKAHGNVGALAINNSGMIRVSGADVDGGRVVLSAVNGNISSTGEITARSGDGSGGGIEIRTGMGEIQVGGILSADGIGNRGGEVALLAPTVQIETGAAVSASGSDGGQIQIGTAPDTGRVNVMPGASVVANGDVGNGGSIETTAGEVVFYPNSTLGAEGELDGGSINVESVGSVQVDGRLSTNGRVGNGGLVDLAGENVLVGQLAMVSADGESGGRVAITAANEARVEGTASSIGTGNAGGTVNVTGNVVNLGTQALIDASGATGGGFINIGGGFQGRVPELRNSSETNVAAGAVMRAEGIQSGNGGQIAVWSDGDTVFYGFASVAGVGNGGVVEVSGKELLTYAGDVDLSGANGANGTLLLDPVDVSIGQVNTDGTGTVGDTDAQEPGLGAGVIDADALIAAWNSGNVVVHTSGVGSGVGKIDIESDVQIIGNSSNSLSFFAHEDINVGTSPAAGGDRGATQIINHGSGNINLIAGWNGGGDSLFGPNLVANADPSNAVDGTTAQAVAPSGSISASDLRAGTYGTFGDAGDINLDPENFFQTEIGSAGGETNFFARNLDASTGNGTDEHTHIGFNTSNFDSGTTVPITGDINIELTGSAFLTSTGNGRRYVQIGHGAHRDDTTGTASAVPLAGDITLNVDNILQMTAGTGNGYVLIGHGGRLVDFPTMSGEIDVDASVLLMTAGVSGSQNFVQVGHGGQQINGTASGGVVVDAQYLEMTARGNDSFAHVGHGGWNVNGDHTGDTTVNGRTVLLRGGTASEAFAMIGLGGYNSDGNLVGDVTVTTDQRIEITGGSGNNNSFAQIGNGGDASSGNHSGAVTLTSGLLTMTSNDNGVASGSRIGHGGHSANGNFSGAITVTLTDALEMNSGGANDTANLGAQSLTQIGHGGYDADGDHSGRIEVTAQSISLQGGLENNRPSIIGHGGQYNNGDLSGDIIVNSNSTISLSGGGSVGDNINGERVFAMIGHSNHDASVGGTVTGDITVTAVDDITLTAGFNDDSYATIGHGGSLANVSGMSFGTSASPADIVVRSTSGSVLLNGGGNDGASSSETRRYATIGHGGAGTSFDAYGSITVEAASSVAVEGGDGTFSYAAIGHGAGESPGSAPINVDGSITVDSGSTINVTGGTSQFGRSNFAQIGHFAQGGNVNLSTTDASTVSVLANGDITLSGNSGLASHAMIGHGGNANGDIVTRDTTPILDLRGDIEVVSTGNLFVLGGNESVGDSSSLIGEGLLQRIYTGRNLSPSDSNLFQTEVVSHALAGDAANVGPWAVLGDNETIVYTGQFYDADGVFGFAENIDDDVLIIVDGNEVIRNSVWHDPTTSIGTNNGNTGAQAGTLNFGMGANNDGWHDIQFIFANGSGGAGASGRNDAGEGINWTGSQGFGIIDPDPVVSVYRADFNTAGEGFTHDSNTVVADFNAAPTFASTTSTWTLEHPGDLGNNPDTDSTLNEFVTATSGADGATNVLRVQDWGGDGNFQSSNIDVTGVDSVVFTGQGYTLGSGANQANEQLQYYYSFDGGATKTTIATFDDSNNVSPLVNGFAIDTTGQNDLVVGFDTNVNGADSGWEIHTVSVGTPGGGTAAAESVLTNLANPLDAANYEGGSTFASVPTFNVGGTDYTSRYRVTATTPGLDSAATTAANGSFAQIGHGGAGNTSSAFTNVNMTGNIDVRTGDSISITNGTGEDAYAKIGHADNLFDNPASGIRSNTSGNIAVAAGDDLNVTGGMIGHAQAASVRLESLTSGSTYIAVSRDPSSNGQGNITIIDDIGDGTGNAGVLTSGGPDLRLYMTDRLPAGATPGTVDNNRIASGTLLNSTSYLHPTEATLRGDEAIAQEFGFSQDSNGRPVGSFGPIGDLVGSNYTIFYSGVAVSSPAGGGGSDGILPARPKSVVDAPLVVMNPTPTPVAPVIPVIPNFRPTFELNVPATETFDQSENVLENPETALNPANQEVEDPALLDGEGVRGGQVTYEGTTGSTGGPSTGQTVDPEGGSPLGGSQFSVEREQGSVSIKMETRDVPEGTGGQSSAEDDELRRRNENEG